MPDIRTAGETLTYGQWDYAIKRRWFPDKSKPLLVGFAEILASNYDRRSDYIFVSQDRLADQCGLHLRATADLYKRVVYQHQMFAVVGQRFGSKGGKPIAKLQWQLPPENMRATGASSVPMAAEATEISGPDGFPMCGILHIDDPWPQVSETPNMRNPAHDLCRDLLCAPDAQASYASDASKIVSNSGIFPSRQTSEARNTRTRERTEWERHGFTSHDDPEYLEWLLAKSETETVTVAAEPTAPQRYRPATWDDD